MKTTHIGNVWKESPGFDAYYLLALEHGDDVKLDELHPLGATGDEVDAYMHQLFDESVLRDGGPGQMFCRETSLLEHFDSHQRIAIAHVRWDV